MAYSESTPLSSLVGRGTPITGRVVHAAVAPGRAAAPPAAQIKTSTPAASAAKHMVAQLLRRPVRRDDMHLVLDAHLVEHRRRLVDVRLVRLAAHDYGN